MNSKRQRLIRALLVAGALALTVPQAALALTPACTTISNRAEVEYTVGTVPQDKVYSKNGSGAAAPTTFNVGVKVNFDVVEKSSPTAATVVVPGDTNKDLIFEITNNSNATLKFALTANAKGNGTANPFGGGLTDTFDATAPATAGAGSPAVYVSGAPASQITLAPGVPTTVNIRSSIPATQVNDDLAVYYLKAQAQWMDDSNITTENATAGNVIGSGATNAACVALGATTVEVVLDDPAGSDESDIARNGFATVRSAYKVVTAGLTISKTSAVYSDPVNGISPTSKAIPGAVVTYTVTITNNGAADATAVKITDDLTAQMGNLDFGNTYMLNNSFKDTVHDCTGGAAKGIVVVGDATPCKTNDALDADNTSFGTPANTIVVSGLTVNKAADAPLNVKTIKYQVTIK